MFLVRGGGGNKIWCPHTTKELELEPEHASWLKIRGLMLQVFNQWELLGCLSHVALRQFFEDTGNQKADTFGL
jgi:hypothetical protein